MITIERPNIVEFEPKEKELIQKFETGLSTSKIYLFALADKLVQNYPDRKWDMLIVDDRGGRLPSRFIRKILSDCQGKTLPTYFIQAGKLARKRIDTQKYTEHARSIVRNSQASRLLIITESVDTFGTVNFIRKLFSSEFMEIDLAAVSSEVIKDNSFNNVYVGGEGAHAIAAVLSTFEDRKRRAIYNLGRLVLPVPLRKNIAKRFPIITTEPVSPLTGLKNSNSPYVAAKGQSGKLSSYFYQRMDLLAREYLSNAVPNHPFVF